MSVHRWRGAAYAAVSGVGFAAATVLSRALATAGVPGASVLSCRFAVAGAALAALVLLRGGSLRPARGELAAAVGLGVVGYATEASLFFAGLERGTAAAVTVVFYAYPAIVTVAEVALGSTALTRRLAVGLAAAMAGTAIVVGAGGAVSLTPAGAAFSLAAAAWFALYLLVTDRALVRTPRPVAACWTTGGAAVGLATRGLVVGGLGVPTHQLPQLLAAGAATAVAFGFLFLALAVLGATRTAIVLNVESLAAVVLGVVFLDEHLSRPQLLGAAVVVAAAVLVTWPGGDGARPIVGDALETAHP